MAKKSHKIPPLREKVKVPTTREEHDMLRLLKSIGQGPNLRERVREHIHTTFITVYHGNCCFITNYHCYDLTVHLQIKLYHRYICT